MSGVSLIEMTVQITLSLLAITCNLHSHSCQAELLLKMTDKNNKTLIQ